MEREKVEERIEALKGELRGGEARVRELEAELARVRDTMLRIDGAILALTELLEPGGGDSIEAAAVRDGPREAPPAPPREPPAIDAA
ncbi:MAG TPA: hypothetical protein VF520_13380 [Thermoleophilaceae bacterium]|jgi:uncharacterized coiled-coil protein SlyX